MVDPFWREDYIDQYSDIFSAHTAVKRDDSRLPTVFIALLIRNGEPFIKLSLACLSKQDYPKDRISIYIRTNNNKDDTLTVLQQWRDEFVSQYASIEINEEDVSTDLEHYNHHTWDNKRLSIIGNLRNETLTRALDSKSYFYFTFDIDTFLVSRTLRELVAVDLPIVAPFLRTESPNSLWSNYFADIDQHGFHQNTPRYLSILSRLITGLIQVPLVHCAYLIRADLLSKLSYTSESGGYEFMNFSASARNAGIQQYIDNRCIYGFNVNLDPQSEETISIINDLSVKFSKSWVEDGFS
jgi:hypothetical protein